MKNFINTKLLTLALAFASFGFADTISITFVTPSVNIAGGYYVGFAGASIKTSGGILTDMDLVCNDFVHVTNIPSGPFLYTVSTLADLSLVRFTQPNQLANYQTAAILLYQLDSLGPVSDAVAGAFQFALWQLFVPLAPTFGDSANVLASAKSLQMSGGGITTAAYAAYRIFTPIGKDASNQEFSGLDFNSTFSSSNPVPEPGSMALMGSGFLMVAFGLRKRAKA